MKYVIGGIGDLLQTLEAATEEREIRVFSHYLNAPQFYKPFNVEIGFTRVESAGDLDWVRPQLSSFEPLSRKMFLSLKPPTHFSAIARERLSRAPRRGQIIGIHPVGSRFSNSVWMARGEPGKWLPVEFLEKLIVPENTYMLFGAREDLLQYTRIASDHVLLICEENIWQSFAYAECCNYVIAVDSAIKSYAAMRNIPSIVLVVDYKDDFRDKMFLDPYGHSMSVIKFRRLDHDVLIKVKEIATKRFSRAGSARKH